MPDIVLLLVSQDARDACLRDSVGTSIGTWVHSGCDMMLCKAGYMAAGTIPATFSRIANLTLLFCPCNMLTGELGQQPLLTCY